MYTSKRSTNWTIRILTVVLSVCLLLVSAGPVFAQGGPPQMVDVIIVGRGNRGPIRAAVRGWGGEVTHELDSIRAVAVRVPASRLSALARNPHVLGVYEDRQVQLQLEATPPLESLVDILLTGYFDTSYPALVGADQLHAEGVTGEGVGVAVVDTGYWANPALSRKIDYSLRPAVYYDAILGVAALPGALPVDLDANGHGTHLTSVIMSSAPGSDGDYNGIAPDAGLVSVRAFEEDGSGRYSDVINGIQWVIDHKDAYNIRVMNLSFSAPPQSLYWDDPLNMAVMQAWQAGIVVVAAAGNRGPDAMTVGVPGNVPYVVTVGAFADNGTPYDASDDYLAEFSSASPTVEGFVKPEVVAPGMNILGLMPDTSYLARAHSDWYAGVDAFYRMSGTSQATAVTSGIVALMLQADPSLTPDEVKCRLMDAARPAVNPDGTLAYSVFQQGAGLVNAYDAVHSTASNCANQGLNIDNDVAGVEHYGGRANRDPDTGDYYIMGLDGYVWGGTYVWGDGYVWGDTYVWGDGYVWGDTYVWGDGYVWGDSYVWGDDYVWGDGYVWGSGGWVPGSP